MSRSSIVTAALAALVLADLQHALVLALRAGQAVKLPGFGRFSLELRSDGTVRPIMRIDHTLISAVAKLDDYHGEVRHRKHIGLTAAEMVALWNAEHPEDPVIVPPREDEAR
jgi:nucleoid DNA-binding protein